MPARTILIVRSDNSTVPRTDVHQKESAMFEKVTEQLLDLRVTWRGTPAVGNALRLCIFGVLAFLALVPVARADTGTTTTPSPAGQSPTVASTTPQQQYWVIPGSGPVTVH